VEPRLLSSLTVSDLTGHLREVLQGEASLLKTLDGLVEDSSFRLLANIPVGAALQGLVGVVPEVTEN
jgi:hypothetical protein